MGSVLLIVSVEVEGHLIYRFLESENYFGVMHNGNAFPKSDGLYCIYTAGDIDLYAEEKPQGINGHSVVSLLN